MSLKRKVLLVALVGAVAYFKLRPQLGALVGDFKVAYRESEAEINAALRAEYSRR